MALYCGHPFPERRPPLPSLCSSLGCPLLKGEHGLLPVHEMDGVVEARGDKDPDSRGQEHGEGCAVDAVEGVERGGKGPVEGVHDAEPRAYSLLPEEDEVPEVACARRGQEERGAGQGQGQGGMCTDRL